MAHNRLCVLRHPPHLRRFQKFSCFSAGPPLPQTSAWRPNALSTWQGLRFCTTSLVRPGWLLGPLKTMGRCATNRHAACLRPAARLCVPAHLLPCPPAVTPNYYVVFQNPVTGAFAGSAPAGKKQLHHLKGILIQVHLPTAVCGQRSSLLLLALVAVDNLPYILGRAPAAACVRWVEGKPTLLHLIPRPGRTDAKVGQCSDTWADFGLLFSGWTRCSTLPVPLFSHLALTACAGPAAGGAHLHPATALHLSPRAPLGRGVDGCAALSCFCHSLHRTTTACVPALAVAVNL